MIFLIFQPLSWEKEGEGLEAPKAMAFASLASCEVYKGRLAESNKELWESKHFRGALPKLECRKVEVWKKTK